MIEQFLQPDAPYTRQDRRGQHGISGFPHSADRCRPGPTRSHPETSKGGVCEVAVTPSTPKPRTNQRRWEGSLGDDGSDAERPNRTIQLGWVTSSKAKSDLQEKGFFQPKPAISLSRLYEIRWGFFPKAFVGSCDTYFVAAEKPHRNSGCEASSETENGALIRCC